ncbi:MAG: asparagine synthase (glutamine-hydrolyzing) [Ruminococcus sp.]|nr:asparagine synthase (glutamine-hydrolyzing) [Ruminococcus sp.]
MCGISGFCSFRENYTQSEKSSDRRLGILKAMRLAIARRGNDQTGEYLRKNTGLSHTRLSIRDIAGGAQPMIRKQNGAEYAVVFNGEIYNTDELTRNLKSFGYEFQTSCDTEAILYAYIQYGTKCVNYLNGIFAFAVWDGAQNKLMLARDRAGVKPLFYTLQNGELIFGSEIKALFAHPDVKPRITADGFREFFGIGPARTHGCGVFDGISEMIPGYFAVFGEKGMEFHQYWDLQSREHTDSYEETVDKVSYLVRDAVTRQMISDVPVCSFLSGGIDSTIVTAISAEYIKNAGGKLNTFSFDFSGNDKYFTSNSFQPERDRPYVDIMLSHIDTNHTYLECDEKHLAELLGEAMRAKDLPGMADVDASLLYFCRLVKEKNKVALTGECADEIFGGYPWFYREDLLSGDGFPWSRNISVRQCLLKDGFTERLGLADYVNERYRQAVKAVPRLDGETPEEAKRREITYLNIKWFMQTLLDRMDRTSMYSGLEARVPFADHRIMEYVFNVPWEMKRKNGVEKSLLRDAFKGVIPDELLHRKKSPYPKTYDPAYEKILSDRLKAIIADRSLPVNEFIDKEKVLRFLEAPNEYGKPWFGQLMTAVQLTAYIIQFSDWLNEYKPEIAM